MLKALVKVRLLSLRAAFFRRGLKSKKSRASGVLMTLAFIYLAVCVMMLAGLLCYSLAEPLAQAGLGWLYHAVVALCAASFCFMGSVFLAQSQIFESRDNELMLSMPIPPRLIVLSRILSLLLLNCVYAAVLMVPALAVYAAQVPSGPSLYLAYAAGIILLPMLATAVTCLAGWCIMHIISRVRRKNLVTGVAMIAFFLGFMYLYMNLQRYAMTLLQRGEEIGAVVRRVMPPFYAFGLCAEGSLLAFAALLAMCVLPLGCVFFVLSHSFQKLATTRRGEKRVRYVARAMPERSVRSALLRKELGYITGFPLYLFNCAIGGPLALVLAGVVWVKGPGIVQSLGAVYGAGDLSFLAPFAVLILCFLAVMNCTTAPSVSLEGPFLWIVRASPVRPRDLFFAKITACLLLCGVPIVLSGVLLAVRLPVNTACRVLLVALPAAAQVLSAYMGLCFNLLLPRLDWVSQAAVVKQSGSVMAAVFAGMGVCAAPAVAYALWLHRSLSFEVFGFAVLGLLCLSCLLMHLYLRRGGAKRLERL